MTGVTRKEGFRYGFYLFGYWLVLLAFSAALVAAGGALVDTQYDGGFAGNQERVLAGLGGFVAFLGVVVFGAGQTGLAYKLVADGVSRGETEVSAGNAHPSESATDEEGQIGLDEEYPPTATSSDGDAGAAATREREASADRGPETPDPKPRGPQGPSAETDTGTSARGTEPTDGQSSRRQRRDPAATDADAGDHGYDGDVADADTETAPSVDPSGRSATGSADETATSAPRSPSESADSGGTSGGPTESAPTETGDGDADADTSAGDGDADADTSVGDGDADANVDDGDAGDDYQPRSPEDVASESEIAEELGFSQSRAERTDDDRSVEEQVNRSTASGSADEDPFADDGADDPLAASGSESSDPLAGSDAEGADPLAESGSEGEAPFDDSEPGDGDSVADSDPEGGGSAAAADVNSDADADDESASDGWTTGENHESGDG